jgi:uncharacterized phage protein (TIGR02218 family)
MAYLDDETGVETSQPREAYEITVPGTTWRLASGVRDIVIDGNAYTASPIRRGTVGPSPTTAPVEFTFELPVSHPLVQRMTQYGGLTQPVTVTVYRQQLTSGEHETIWAGEVSGVSIEGNIATISAPSPLGSALRRRLPMVTASRSCRHVLFDGLCGVSRAAHLVSTTIANVNGRNVTIASIGGKPNAWARYGTLRRVSTGEEMTIVEQTGTALVLKAPIIGLSVGESVEVAAGCARDIATCRDKFANVPNFGGFPQMPLKSRFRVGGPGLYTSETTEEP